MITLYKNRVVDYTERVKVYRNLNRAKGTKSYSIQQYGLVVGHADELELEDCRFVISEKGRQRVIKKQTKNVHAFVTGKISTLPVYKVFSSSEPTCDITYNPYLYSKFMRVSDDGNKYEAGYCSAVRLDDKGMKGVFIGHS